jgi:hypothetical protein
MLSSKMIYQSTAKVINHLTLFLTQNSFEIILQLSLFAAVQACLKLNLSLLIAGNNAKIAPMMNAISGKRNIIYLISQKLNFTNLQSQRLTQLIFGRPAPARESIVAGRKFTVGAQTEHL